MGALGNDPDQLIAALNELLLHGTMSGEMRHIISEAVASIPADNRRLRADRYVSHCDIAAVSSPAVKGERHMALTRRAFICRSFASFGTAALAFERFGLLQALAQAGDYKALVYFLFGGNDSGNMLIPYDDYATYAAVRRATGLAIPQSSLLPINVPSLGSQCASIPV